MYYVIEEDSMNRKRSLILIYISINMHKLLSFITSDFFVVLWKFIIYN